jgi:exodeoxyribonuclease VII large subunit
MPLKKLLIPANVMPIEARADNPQGVLGRFKLEIFEPQYKRKIYSVSELTSDIKKLLENKYPMVWISGEISNLKVPSSGHVYFALKDKNAQIAAVMFRGQVRQLKFDLRYGMSLVGLGRISVYEPRGTYQIILEYAEPMGVGALQIAFEQLKQKLFEEGLFSEQHKSALPFLPGRIGVITSPTGSVVQDILSIAQRRFPNIPIDIYPVRVQGLDSAGEIVAAIESANRIGRDEVLILARGGGSLEDLAPFNTEQVARAIYNSQIPLVSAVGHETDYSIADFVSDYRAPTPSAAAEIVIPLKSELKSRCLELTGRAYRAMRITLQGIRNQIVQYDRMLVHPGRKIQDMRLHLDQLVGRLRRDFSARLQQQHARYEQTRTKVIHHGPSRVVAIHKAKVDVLIFKLSQSIKIISLKNYERLRAAQAVLKAMNPSSILQRGYSITRTVPHGRVVMNARGLYSGQPLEIRLAEGQVKVIVQDGIKLKHKE